jgi:hypothetical protein
VKEINRPLPGLYRRRLVKGGPWQPVKLFLDPAVDHEGRRADRAPLLAMWTPEGTIHDRSRISAAWPGLHPIERREFDTLCHGPLVHQARDRVALHEQATLF